MYYYGCFNVYGGTVCVRRRRFKATRGTRAHYASRKSRIILHNTRIDVKMSRRSVLRCTLRKTRASSTSPRWGDVASMRHSSERRKQLSKILLTFASRKRVPYMKRNRQRQPSCNSSSAIQCCYCYYYNFALYIERHPRQQNYEEEAAGTSRWMEGSLRLNSLRPLWCDALSGEPTLNILLLDLSRSKRWKRRGSHFKSNNWKHWT
jgi:hypothetical protein